MAAGITGTIAATGTTIYVAAGITGTIAENGTVEATGTIICVAAGITGTIAATGTNADYRFCRYSRGPPIRRYPSKAVSRYKAVKILMASGELQS